MSIIIPKSNKPSYNNPKTFQPIILLNILGKLIKKVISSRLQVHSTTLNFIYPNQMEDIKQQLIIDASIYLTHLIQVEWIKGLHTSTLALDIAQFFSS